MDESGRDHVEPLGLERATVVRSRRPRALWAVLAVAAVATGALVVTSADDDGGQRPGLPVALGSAASPMAAEAADSMLAWITYVAGDDLPALGGNAPAYRLAGDVSEDQVGALADALGLDGDAVQDGPSWRVSGPDGTLEVYEGAGAQWWFSSANLDGSGTSSSGSSGSVGGCDDTPGAAADCLIHPPYPDCVDSEGGIVGCEQVEPPVGDCAVHADGFDPCSTACANVEDDTCLEIVPPPEPPADLPSEAEARSIALDLLARAGMDVDDAVVTVDDPYDAWYMVVEPRLDGLPSGLLANVSVGSGGEVTTAGGHLGTPERLGDYPRLDTRATIDRANAQQAVPFGDTSTGVGIAESAVGGPYPAEQAPVPEEPAEAPAIAPCSSAGDPASTTCDTVSEPTTTTINVLGCKPQPDGREICEPIEPGITCPQVAAPADEPLGAPETLECTPPPPEPGDGPIPLPEPQPLEIVLVDAEPTLMLLPAVDGSEDAYLVPAYRFTDDEDGRVDLPAVDDASLTTPPSTDTTSPPDTIEPPEPVEPGPCEVAVEQDSSGTTHTVQPSPGCTKPEPVVLPDGVQPELGVGYYVDVDTTCHGGSFTLGAETWNIEEGAVAEWASPHEGGIFTLDAPDRGTFVGDVGASKVATFRPRSPEAEYVCAPVPRR